MLPVRLLLLLLALRPLLALLWAPQWLLPHLFVLQLPRLKSSLLPCKSHHRLLQLQP